MLRAFYLIFIILLSCSDSLNEINLENKNTILKLKIPKVFDRYQKTIHYSDCGCYCNAHEYIYYSSELDNIPKKDTLGYYDFNQTKDIFKSFSLTISHNTCKFKRINKKHRFEFYNEAIGNYCSNYKELKTFGKLYYDKNLKVNIQLFKILAGPGTKQNGLKYEWFLAVTYINDEEILFQGHRVNHSFEEGEFSDILFEIINSVQFKVNDN